MVSEDLRNKTYYLSEDSIVRAIPDDFIRIFPLMTFYQSSRLLYA